MTSSVHGRSFDDRINNLKEVLARCIEIDLVLNWEKDRRNSSWTPCIKEGNQTRQSQIEVIQKLPPPEDVKGFRSVLGHAGFYRRFIKDFSKIAKPLTNVFANDVKFNFNEDCLHAFETLKTSLTTAPIVQPLNWKLPFELTCDASDDAIGAALGRRIDKRLSKAWDATQVNYTITKKEMLAVVYAFEKF